MKFLQVLFQDELRFDVSPQGEAVFPGDTTYKPFEILIPDSKAYDHEFRKWLDDEWLPRQYILLDSILQLHGNNKRFTDLCNAFKSDFLVPVVGSGMSCPSGLPLWSDFLRSIRSYSPSTSIDDLEALLKASAFEEAAEILATSITSRLFDERIEHDLRIDDISVLKGPVWFLPSLFPKLVITINLDDVLEHIYVREEKPFSGVLVGADIGRFRQMISTASLLLKLHGDCRRNDGRVLSQAEYDATYNHGSAVAQELTLLFKTRQLLFLGCSLGPDRIVQHIASVSAADPHAPKHFAFLALPSDDQIRLNRENFLAERGIFPIWYKGDHSACIEALLVGILNRTGRL